MLCSRIALLDIDGMPLIESERTGVNERECRIRAEREPLWLTTSAIDERPRLRAVRRHTKREAASF